jgi:hypothetical protein
MQLNLDAAVTGDPDSGAVTNLNGITLGCRNDVAFFTNVDVHELAVYSGAHSPGLRTRVNAALMAKWGVS